MEGVVQTEQDRMLQLFRKVPCFEGNVLPELDADRLAEAAVDATIESLAPGFDHCRNGDAATHLKRLIEEDDAHAPVLPTPEMSTAQLEAMADPHQLLAVQMVVQQFKRRLAAGLHAPPDPVGACLPPFRLFLRSGGATRRESSGEDAVDARKPCRLRPASSAAGG